MDGRLPHEEVSSAQSSIPDKLYFKIGEVSQLVGVHAHLLRYWEKEVPGIRPSKSISKQRRYRRRDVEIFREIRRLLYEEKYTLAGAKKRLLTTSLGAPAPVEAPAETTSSQPGLAAEHVADIRAGLVELIHLAGEEP